MHFVIPRILVSLARVLAKSAISSIRQLNKDVVSIYV